MLLLDIYEYYIENMSRPINNDELKKEKQLHYEVCYIIIYYFINKVIDISTSN